MLLSGTLASLQSTGALSTGSQEQVQHPVLLVYFSFSVQHSKGQPSFPPLGGGACVGGVIGCCLACSVARCGVAGRGIEGLWRCYTLCTLARLWGRSMWCCCGPSRVCPLPLWPLSDTELLPCALSRLIIACVPLSGALASLQPIGAQRSAGAGTTTATEAAREQELLLYFSFSVVTHHGKQS